MSDQLQVIKDLGAVIKAELDIQITTAKAYPRDVKKFIDTAVMLATIDEETAESCGYCLTRKDREGNITKITGPSIRLAEIAAQCWGNLHAATRIIGNDGKHITAEGVAWDLERNVRMASEVNRSIMTSSGKTYGAEMQAVTGNAAAAIALRNAIFKVVPKALVDRIHKQALAFAVGDQKTLNEKRQKLFQRFKLMGIEQERIFKFFNKEKLDDFTLEDIETLIGVGTSIKDGLLSKDNAFVLDEELANMEVRDRLESLLKNKEGNL
jgi:hypothetical protein